MTLSTNLYVLDRVDVHELFRFCQELLTKYDDRTPPQTPDQQETRDELVGWREDGSWRISNVLGQGLPGILDITYRPDGPLRTADQAAAHAEDQDCEPDCTGEYHPRACWADVDFDTAYGYRDEAGRGCGDLHALLVAEVGQWLDGRGIRWEWKNEFTGEVHGGGDRYARLVDLATGGSEASAWFRSTALPAIIAHAAGGGR
jgi:hypothetical protein